MEIVMFLDNKYKKIYFSIISRAKGENRSKKVSYFERHHIIPKSMGGSNKKDNLILLTAKEHFICHLLLVKMTEGHYKAKMVYGITSMRFNRYGQRYTSNLYHFFKAAFFKGISGPLHPLYGKPRTKKTRDLISINVKKALAGKPGVNLGKAMSTETKEKLSKSLKGKMAGKNHPMFGKKHSLKSIENYKIANKGERNPNFGKSHSAETKMRISAGNKGARNPNFGMRNMYHSATGEKIRVNVSQMEAHIGLGFIPAKNSRY